MNRRHVPFVAATLSLAISSTVHASGFAVIEQSASGIGTAFAGTGSSAEDASGLYYNPAIIGRLDNAQMVAGLHAIDAKLDFTNEASSAMLGGPLSGPDSSSTELGLVPNFYYTTPINAQWSAGIGVNAPFGLTTDYDEGWVGRYHSLRSAMKTVNINPSFAYKANDKLSLGFGVSAQYVDVELSQAVDYGTVLCGLPAPLNALCNPQQLDGTGTVEGNSWAFGWNVGLLYDITPATSLGLAYRSAVRHDIKGDASYTFPNPIVAGTFAALGLFQPTAASTELDMPASLILSATHRYSDRLNVMVDAMLVDWSSLQELRIQYANPSQPDTVAPYKWEDSLRLSVGASYRYSNDLKLRAGIAYDGTSIPDDEHRPASMPGQDQIWLTLGSNIQIDDKSSVDLGYAHLFIPEAGMNNTTEGGIQHTLNGGFDTDVNIFSVQYNYSF